MPYEETIVNRSFCIVKHFVIQAFLGTPYLYTFIGKREQQGQEGNPEGVSVGTVRTPLIFLPS